MLTSPPAPPAPAAPPALPPGLPPGASAALQLSNAEAKTSQSALSKDGRGRNARTPEDRGSTMALDKGIPRRLLGPPFAAHRARCCCGTTSVAGVPRAAATGAGKPAYRQSARWLQGSTVMGPVRLALSAAFLLLIAL